MILKTIFRILAWLKKSKVNFWHRIYNRLALCPRINKRPKSKSKILMTRSRWAAIGTGTKSGHRPQKCNNCQLTSPIKGQITPRWMIVSSKTFLTLRRTKKLMNRITSPSMRTVLCTSSTRSSSLTISLAVSRRGWAQEPSRSQVQFRARKWATTESRIWSKWRKISSRTSGGRDSRAWWKTRSSRSSGSRSSMNTSRSSKRRCKTLRKSWMKKRRLWAMHRKHWRNRLTLFKS